MSDASGIEQQPPELLRLLDSGNIPSELIENIPPEKRADFVHAVMGFRFEIEQVEHYSGMVPHPSVVERYEATLPGSADRILTMAEERQAASIDVERQQSQRSHSADMTIIQGFLRNERLGMVLIVVMALVIVLLGVRVIELGHSAEGFAMVAGAAGGIIIAFVKSYGHAQRQPADLESH